MKILFLPDSHGSLPKLPKSSTYDLIVHPGDFNDNKKIFPYILEWLAIPQALRSMFPDWTSLVEPKEAKQLIKDSAQAGIHILQQLNALQKTVYTIHGNWDYKKEHESMKYTHKYDFDTLLKKYKHIHSIDFQAVDLGSHMLIGYPCFTGGPEYPQRHLKSYSKKALHTYRKDYNRYSKALQKLAKKAKKPLIFLTHNPPYGCAFSKIKAQGNVSNGLHVGSVVARDFIKTYRTHIDLVLCGHMHEHFGQTTMYGVPIVCTGLGNQYALITQV